MLSRKRRTTSWGARSGEAAGAGALVAGVLGSVALQNYYGVAAGIFSYTAKQQGQGVRCPRCKNAEFNETKFVYCPECGLEASGAVIKKCQKCGFVFTADADAEHVGGPESAPL